MNNLNIFFIRFHTNVLCCGLMVLHPAFEQFDIHRRRYLWNFRHRRRSEIYRSSYVIRKVCSAVSLSSFFFFHPNGTRDNFRSCMNRERECQCVTTRKPWSHSALYAMGVCSPSRDFVPPLAAKVGKSKTSFGLTEPLSMSFQIWADRINSK